MVKRSALNSKFLFNTVWNNIRYPKSTVYINSTRIIDDLHMLKILMLCRRVENTDM